MSVLEADKYHVDYHHRPVMFAAVGTEVVLVYRADGRYQAGARPNSGCSTRSGFSDAPLTEVGYRFFTLAQAGDDETTRRKLYALVREGVCDTPGFSGEFESYAAFMERIYTRSYWQHAQSQFLAEHTGDWVGLSSFVQQADGQGIFGLTVVTRAHRGKGIARALKLLGVQYARGSGVRSIVTENHPENASILGLNKALGFKENSDDV